MAKQKLLSCLSFGSQTDPLTWTAEYSKFSMRVPCKILPVFEKSDFPCRKNLKTNMKKAKLGHLSNFEKVKIGHQSNSTEYVCMHVYIYIYVPLDRCVAYILAGFLVGSLSKIFCALRELRWSFLWSWFSPIIPSPLLLLSLVCCFDVVFKVQVSDEGWGVIQKEGQWFIQELCLKEKSQYYCSKSVSVFVQPQM